MIRQHAIDRALERYGLKLTEGDMLDLCRQCQTGYGRLSFNSDGKERHLVESQKKVLVVIYAPPTTANKHGRIITVLPPEAATSKSSSSLAGFRNSQRLKPKARLPKKNRQRKGY